MMDHLKSAGACEWLWGMVMFYLPALERLSLLFLLLPLPVSLLLVGLASAASAPFHRACRFPLPRPDSGNILSFDSTPYPRIPLLPCLYKVPRTRYRWPGCTNTFDPRYSLLAFCAFVPSPSFLSSSLTRASSLRKHDKHDCH
ncbi:hypothetical protein GGR56DRAFT_659119 [Xylariaceae sp. FL0804]|nr:hypothetical protein GGR56DRAFT_659119 [Xylariaceae sp. FL0804]